MGDWFRIHPHGGVNYPRQLTFTDLASGERLVPDYPVSGQPRSLYYINVGFFRDVLISASGYESQTLNTGGIEQGQYMSQAIDVHLWHRWPYEVRFGDLQSTNPPFGLPLDDGDFIQGVRQDNVLPANVVEIWIHSDLSYFKRISVPDGEGASWDIWTGKYLGGQRFDDGIGLWAHQINNGQSLTFWKAKTLGTMSRTYMLRVDSSWISPGSKVTFNWLRDFSAGNA